MLSAEVKLHRLDVNSAVIGYKVMRVVSASTNAYPRYRPTNSHQFPADGWRKGDKYKSHALPTFANGRVSSPRVGFHAYKTARTAFNAAGSWDVVTRVKLFGHVVEHKNGYRAQYMLLT
jgi:hypothetical protein